MSEAPSVSTPDDSRVRLGLKENWRQFALLVLINAFVGGMVGIERTVVPLIGVGRFHIASTTLVVSFIVSFGVIKALANLVSGQLADAWGRKRVLVLGWLVGLPVPVHDHVGAELGMDRCGQCAARHQSGSCLVDDGDHEDRSRRAEVARSCRRPQRIRRLSRRRRRPRSSPAISPRDTGFARCRSISASAMRCSGRCSRSCSSATRATTSGSKSAASATASPTPLSFGEIFVRTSFGDRNLFAASQAGLVNNLNDGMSWGIFPLFFAAFGLGVERIGILKAVYPAIWGILQVATGPLSDRWGRKGLIVAGMWVQAAGLFLTAATRSSTGGSSAAPARPRNGDGLPEL